MAEKTFKYREGRRFGVPAQVAGERLEEIRQAGAGVLTPAAVVEDASDPDSPLHPVFPWDDAEAAQKHRESLARMLIASVYEIRLEIVHEQADPRPTKHLLYVSVGQPKAGGARYVATTDAMASPDMQRIVIDQCLSQIAAWKRRYEHLFGEAEVANAIRALAADVEAASPKPRRKAQRAAANA